MGVSKPNSGSFTSGRQPATKRGKSKRTRMLEALKAEGMSEQDLWVRVLRLGLDGDSSALTSFLNRLAVPNKSTLPKFQMRDLDERFFDLSEVGQIKFLTWLVFRGEIAPDQASVVANMISTTSSLITTRVDSDRLDAVEEIQNAHGKVISGTFKNDILHKVIKESYDDAQLLKEIAQASISDPESESDPNNPQMTIDDMLDNANTNVSNADNNNDDEELPRAVSLHDIVQGNESKSNSIEDDDSKIEDDNDNTDTTR